jgi:hypothetical protein
MRKKTQTFNDGVAKIYKVDNISAPGNLPKQGLVVKHEKLRYSEEKVGITRFYSGMQAKIKIDSLLRFPRINSVKSLDILIPNDGNQYKIAQIQYPQDIYPPSMDLSLERLEEAYEIK